MAYESWHVISELQNGWTGTISYAKNGAGRIKIKGQITPGTKAWGTLITTMPAEYKPPVWMLINVFAVNGDVLQGIAINSTDGSIKIYNPATASDNTSTWVFYVEYDS